MSRIKIGTYDGDGSAQNISLGWTPDYLRIWNVEDGDIVWDWFNGLGAGDALQVTNHADTQVSLITSNGVDTYAGSSSAAKGFTVGTTLSESGKTYRYMAIAEDEY